MTIAFHSACFFSTDNGATVQARISAASELAHPLPSGVTNIFRFDETMPNNAALLAAWGVNATPFTMSGNTVLRSGSAAGFDDPGLLYRALQNADSLFTKASTTGDAFSREEQAQYLALSFRGAGLI